MSENVATPESYPPTTVAPESVQGEDRHAKLVELLKADKPVMQALIDAGYTRKQAKKGWAAVPKSVIAELIEQGMKFERIGDALIKAPSKMEKRIIGAMHERMVTGAKDGVNAAKILTQHKSIANQFVQDAGASVLVIQAPTDWKPPDPGQPPKPIIDALPPTEDDLPEYE